MLAWLWGRMAWLWDRLLRWVLGGDLWYTTLLSMGVREVEKVKDK